MGTRRKSQEQVNCYLDAIRPILSSQELADHMDTSNFSTRRWLQDEGGPGTWQGVNKLGELAATITFLRTELDFDEKDTKDHLTSIFIDPDTYQPTTMMDQINSGNCSMVIQTAIEISIE
jgi:uncharacterized protein with NRDE domain